MINIEKDGVISYGINIQKIKIHTIDNKIISREIIYPLGEKLSDVKKYIKNSLPEIKKFEILKSDIGLCFLDPHSKKHIVDNTNLIDAHWIDGETYLFDYKNNNENKHLLIVIDSNIEKEEIVSFINDDEISLDILFVDQLNDCWIKRDMLAV